MNPLLAKRVVISGPYLVEIDEVPISTDDLGPYELVVKARRSVVSPGTELSRYREHMFGGVTEENPLTYPAYPGYSMIGTVIAAGSSTGFEEGTTVLSFTPHQSLVRFDCREDVCIRVPSGVNLDRAPFARLAKVGGISIQASRGRPGDVLAVVGLGPIGNLAAQLAKAGGYEVVGIEQRPERLSIARSCGLQDVVSVEDAPARLRELGGARVVLECSGRAAGALLATEICAPHGEVMTVGAPWIYEADISATALLTKVFAGFLSLRSGWELQFRKYDDNGERSIASVTSWAFSKLVDGSLVTEPLVGATLPAAEAATAFKLIDSQPDRYMTVLLDWEAE